MLPLIFGTLGVAGALYLLLNLIWPGWYQDWYYRTTSQRVGQALMDSLMKKKYLIDFFEGFVKTTPDKTFILYEDKKFTYKDMDKMANKCARAMIEIGVKPGAVVAVLSKNEPGIVWTYLGLLKAGYQIAFINYNLRDKSLSHCVTTSGAKTLLIGEGEELVNAVQKILTDIPNVSIYLQGATAEQKPASFLSLDLVMSRVSDAPIEKSVRDHVLPFTPSIYIYTSGTTGLPKPAVVPHIRVLGAAHAFQSFKMTANDILYEPLPMYHSAALLVGFANVITTGATMVLRDKFSATHFWDDCRKHDVTIIQYIGEVCRYLVARPKANNDGVHKIRVAFGNGLRQDIWAEFKNRFKIPRLIEFYGATECPIGLSNLDNKFGACGRSSPYLRQSTPAAFVKFDLEAQAPLRNRHGRCVPIGPDEVGLLVVPLIEGKSSFQGYKGNRAASDKKLLYDVFEEGDKFFNSGDLMKVDKDYYVYFNDRVGDTFRWKGENVSTTEVSNMLTDLDFIHDANVYGVMVPGSDGRAGMVALTLMDNSGTLTPERRAALSKHVREVLPAYARPRFLRIKKEFDMTSTFKQQKMSLVQEGFDVTKTNDEMYYFNMGTQTYQPLDHVVNTLVMAGKVPL